jgi:hypothetical protein
MAPIQFSNTDAKDVGAFTVAVAERDLPGAYNVGDPAGNELRFANCLTAQTTRRVTSRS